jgi:hypothetical protein
VQVTYRLTFGLRAQFLQLVGEVAQRLLGVVALAIGRARRSDRRVGTAPITGAGRKIEPESDLVTITASDNPQLSKGPMAKRRKAAKGKPKSWAARWRGWLTEHNLKVAEVLISALSLFLSGGLVVLLAEFFLTRETNDAAQVRACEEKAQLTTDREQRWIYDPSAPPSPSPIPIGQEYLECEWPPPDYADADGYSFVRLLSGEGPGESEASDATVVDRVTASCDRMELTYSFGTQGFDEDFEPFEVALGDVVHARGGGGMGRRASAPIPTADRGRRRARPQPHCRECALPRSVA